MLRKFRIAINGKEYMVEMEELGVPNTVTPSVAPNVVHEQVATPQPVVVAAPTPIIQASNVPGLTIEAPMPGSILDICVKVGDVVSEDQALVILEAMKMENELVAPKAGTITAIHVTKGSPVDVGAPIVTIS